MDGEKIMKKLSLVLALAIALPLSAQAKPALCHIEQYGQVVLHQKCDFYAEKGGSFSLSHFNKGKPLLDDVTDVSVTIIAPNVAEVSGLTRDGINSRWGEFHRSQSEKACWVDGETKICAWGL